MGSTGTGNFSDYSNLKPQNPNDETGGNSGVDICDRAFSTKLEEVTRSDYYIKNGSVPSKGTKIEIYLNKRIVAKTLDGVDIGLLPTKYNYVKLCIVAGYKHIGEVSSSTDLPIQTVTIDVIPTHG